MAAASARKAVPAPVRHDPRRQWLSGVPQMELVNKDDRKTYKLVSNESKFQDPSFYSAMGWEPEIATQGGVRFVAAPSARIGEPIMWWDSLLMSIDTSKLSELEAYGQAQADEVENRLIDKSRGELDGLRGIGTFLKFRNQTQQTEMESENG